MCLCAPFIALAPTQCGAQESTWSARLVPPRARAGEGARILVSAVTAPGWHLYSTTQPPGGARPTRIVLLPSRGLKARGKVSQPPPMKKRNPIFNITDELYQGAVSFALPVVLETRVRGPQKGTVEVRFQLCSDRLCSPPQTVRVPFAWTPQPERASKRKKRFTP
jgi:thiol:disulfide interchange protein DsbD